VRSRESGDCSRASLKDGGTKNYLIPSFSLANSFAPKANSLDLASRTLRLSKGRQFMMSGPSKRKITLDGPVSPPSLRRKVQSTTTRKASIGMLHGKRS
jgi:hypothetical protein